MPPPLEYGGNDSPFDVCPNANDPEAFQTLDEHYRRDNGELKHLMKRLQRTIAKHRRGER